MSQFKIGAASWLIRQERLALTFDRFEAREVFTSPIQQFKLLGAVSIVSEFVICLLRVG